jgi:hypothetical protein
VRELLARGAAVDTADNDGSTPLFIASSKGHLAVVRELPPLETTELILVVRVELVVLAVLAKQIPQ